jgi:type IV fimbrial biogenesis protein FimT
LYKDSGEKCQLRDRAGFSLLELMTVIVIIGILAAVAIPNLGGWLGKKDLDSVTMQMFSDLQRARSEAITRGLTVTIQIKTGTGGWYKIYDSTGSQIIPQTVMPNNNITVASTTFTADTSGFTSRGFATQLGSIKIHNNSAPAANRDRTIALSLGGALSIN